MNYWWTCFLFGKTALSYVQRFVTTPEKRRLSGWLTWFVVLNGVILSLMASGFVAYMPALEGGLTQVYLPLALLGHFSLLVYLLALPLFLLLLFWPSRGLLLILSVAAASVGVILLKIDLLVYAQYRFHISGFVVDLALNSGDEVFNFSADTWWQMQWMVAVVLLLESLLAWAIWRYRARFCCAGKVTLSLLGVIVVSHAIHAWADAAYDQRITRLTRHIPAYHPATALDFFERYGWVDMRENRAARRLRVEDKSTDLNYPLVPLRCAQRDEKALNVLLIVADTVRADVLNHAVMPHLHSFSEGAQTVNFKQHFSGGNSTQAGIFSLFYGLPATYWNDMYGNQVGPVLMSQLLKEEYRFSILSSSKLTSPAFDRTVFSEFPNLRLFYEGNEPWLRDEAVLDEWFSFLDNCQDETPFFGFLFLDSVHGYSFPDTDPAPFEPMWEEVNHLELNDEFDPEPYFNRYKVAAHYLDSLLGEVLDDLKQRGLLENTVVVITSDHGEEFNDNGAGYWGHGSNFTSAQTQVPLLIHWPKRQGREVEYRTSHLDLVPTLMQELLHCDNPIRDYSSGHSLFDNRPRPWMVIGSYFNYGIVEPDRVTVTYPTGHYEIVDLHNRTIKNAVQRPQVVMPALQEMSRFYR
ncbi:MAG: DUF3413 domain-containing protein [Gammaproteobacteria bacterium]|nr:DUF3413 domain-containing protein [Gammaproteobacteria bacterium]